MIPLFDLHMKRVYSTKSSMILAGFVCLIIIYACKDTYQLEPTVATFQVADSNITATTAKLSGQIQVLGTQKITEYGVEVYKISITSVPIVKGYSTTATTDTFTVVFDGLQPNTLYYYWAYAQVNTTDVHSQAAFKFTTKSAR
jgi:hypothetical protein